MRVPKILNSPADIPEPFKRIWAELIESVFDAAPLADTRFMQAVATAAPAVAFQLIRRWLAETTESSRNFPRLSSALAERAPETAGPHPQQLQYLLTRNAWEEFGESHYPQRSHFELALSSARLQGATDTELATHQPLPITRHQVRTQLECCRSHPFDRALGLLALIENLTGVEFTLVKAANLRCWPEATDRPLDHFIQGGGADYYDVNIKADEGHADDMEWAIALWLTTEGIDLIDERSVRIGLVSVVSGMTLAYQLRLGVLDGVYQAVMAEHSALEPFDRS